MKNIIIIGKTNVGKSLFLVSFSEYMGLKKVFLKIEYPNGKVLTKEMSTSVAKDYLSSSEEFKTQCIQSIEMKIPVYKGYKEIRLMDTSGLSDGIHPSYIIRNSIIQTLDCIDSADIIVHIIDICDFIPNSTSTISQIDLQINKYGLSRNGYVLLANKVDLDINNKGIDAIKSHFKGTLIIPVSALTKKGFREVKTFVYKSL